MIPSASDLAAIARKRQGTLSEVPFPALLRSLVDGHRTVVLKVSRGPVEKHISIEDGLLVDCESNLLHENLGRVLVGQGKLSEDIYQKALATAAAQEKSLADVLITSRAVSSYDLFKVMQQSLAHKLLDVFAWEAGAFVVLGDAPEASSPLKVNVAQLVVTGVLRAAPQAHVDAAIGVLVGRPLGVHPHPPTPLSSLRLSTKHQKALAVLRQRKRLDELMTEAGLSPSEITRLVYALAVLGVVAPADTLPAEVPKITGVFPVADPVSSPGTPADDGAREAVMDLYMRRRKGDAFDLLGLSTTTTPADVASAYIKLSESCAPWRHSDAGVKEKAEELFLLLARAYAELVDGDARARVVERRNRAAQPVKPRADVYAIKTSLLDAGGQFTEGKAHKEAGRYAQALPLLEFAADLDAQNAVYRAEAAHCRFLAAPESQSQKAMQMLAEAMRLDPQCALACYYAGMIHIANGDLVRARTALGEAVRLAPKEEKAKQALASLPK